MPWKERVRFAGSPNREHSGFQSGGLGAVAPRERLETFGDGLGCHSGGIGGVLLALVSGGQLVMGKTAPTSERSSPNVGNPELR